jgi:hypothetical protein
MLPTFSPVQAPTAPAKALTPEQGGQFCPPGASSPFPCLRGTYQDLLGQEGCVDCKVGTFQSFESKSDCTVCLEGHHCPNTGMSNPAPCPKGLYQPAEGADACVACPGGTYQDQEGSTDCKECRSGFFCTAGTPEETMCPKGNLTLSSRQSSLCLGGCW